MNVARSWMFVAALASAGTTSAGPAPALAFFVVDAALLGPALKSWRTAVRQQQAAQHAATAQAAEAGRREAELCQGP